MTKTEGAILSDITRSINAIPEDRLNEYATTLLWGTFGPKGDELMKARYLNDLETNHLENILVTRSHIGAIYRKVILHIIKRRLCGNPIVGNQLTDSNTESLDF